MKLFSFCLVLGSLLVVGCQSTRLAAPLPAVREYGAMPPRQGPTATHYDDQTATLPTFTASTAPTSLPEPELLPSKKPKLPHTLLSGPSTQPLTPDTVVRRLPTPGPDPATTRTNIIGGVIGATGIGLLLTADFDDLTQSSSPNEGNYGQIVVGLFLTALGIGMAFYQGKNGRRRLQREARRAERPAKIKPDSTSEVETEANRKKASRRFGLYLMLGGALLGGIGFLLNPLATLGFFLVGSILLVTGFLFAIGFI